jgi:hypothetical protein
MSTADWISIVDISVTAAVAVIGLWLVQSVRAQMRLRIEEVWLRPSNFPTPVTERHGLAADTQFWF